MHQLCDSLLSAFVQALNGHSHARRFQGQLMGHDLPPHHCHLSYHKKILQSLDAAKYSVRQRVALELKTKGSD